GWREAKRPNTYRPRLPAPISATASDFIAAVDSTRNPLRPCGPGSVAGRARAPVALARGGRQAPRDTEGASSASAACQRHAARAGDPERPQDARLTCTAFARELPARCL